MAISTIRDGGKEPFIPANKVQQGYILDIQRAVAQSEFCELYKLKFIPETYRIYTTALKFLDGIHVRLMSDSKDSINIGGLIKITKSGRYRETNEKNGNINCFIELGDIGRQVLEKGIDGFDDIFQEDEIMKEYMTFAQNYARKELMLYGYGFNTHGYEIYQTTLMFLIYAIITVKQYAENPNIDENEFKLIIGTFFTIHFRRENGKINLYFSVNKTYKTTVKSDLQTEKD